MSQALTKSFSNVSLFFRLGEAPRLVLHNQNIKSRDLCVPVLVEPPETNALHPKRPQTRRCFSRALRRTALIIPLFAIVQQ